MPSTRPQFGGRYRGTASQRNHERERVLADGTRLAALTLVMEFVALTLMALSHVATRESGAASGLLDTVDAREFTRSS